MENNNTFAILRRLYDYGQEPVPEVTPQVWAEGLSREAAEENAAELNSAAGKTDWVLTGSVFDPCYWQYEVIAGSEAGNYPKA